MGCESARSLVMASAGLAPICRGRGLASPPPRVCARTRSGAAPSPPLGKAGLLPAGTDSSVEWSGLKTQRCPRPSCCRGLSAVGTSCIRSKPNTRLSLEPRALGHAVGAHTVSLGVPAQDSPILRFPSGVVGLGEVVVEAPWVTQRLSPCPSRPVPSVHTAVLCLPLDVLASQPAPVVMSSLYGPLVSHQRARQALGVIFLGQSDLVALVLSAARRLAGDAKRFALPLCPAAVGVCVGLRVVAGVSLGPCGAEAQRAPVGKPVKVWRSSSHMKGSRPGKLSHGIIKPCDLLASARRDWTRS